MENLKEMSDMELLNWVCNLAAKSVLGNMPYVFDDYSAAREELEKRLVAYQELNKWYSERSFNA